MGGKTEPAPAMAATAPQAPPPVQPPVQAAVYHATPQPAYADGEPPKDSPYAVVGTGGFIGTMLLFCIPVIGWIACIIMAFAAKNRNRRNFARAMPVFLIIGLILSVALYFVFSWIWSAAAEYMQQYINEATGGLGNDLGGLGLDGLFGLFG
jgi:amino acid transporter